MLRFGIRAVSALVLLEGGGRIGEWRRFVRLCSKLKAKGVFLIRGNENLVYHFTTVSDFFFEKVH